MLSMIQSLSFTLRAAAMLCVIICVCFSQHVTFNMHEPTTAGGGAKKLHLYPPWIKAHRFGTCFLTTYFHNVALQF